jgi:hypothetical protein
MAKAAAPLQLLDGQLKEVIAPFLEGAGFARTGRTRLWVRASATAKGVCHLVWFQVGEPASSLGGRFTAEVGVYYPRYDRFANRRDLLGPVIGACHLDARRRVGMFLPTPEDKWWPYTGASAALARHVAAVKGLLEEHGLPWLAAADSPANEAVYNTGKMPEPDRLRREAFERRRAARDSS